MIGTSRFGFQARRRSKVSTWNLARAVEKNARISHDLSIRACGSAFPAPEVEAGEPEVARYRLGIVPAAARYRQPISLTFLKSSDEPTLELRRFVEGNFFCFVD